MTIPVVTARFARDSRLDRLSHKQEASSNVTQVSRWAIESSEAPVSGSGWVSVSTTCEEEVTFVICTHGSGMSKCGEVRTVTNRFQNDEPPVAERGG